MMLIRIFLRLVLVPVALALTLVKWICVFLLCCTGWMFRLLAMVFFLTAAGSYLFGLEDSGEALRILAVSFIVFMLPVTAGWILEIITFLNDRITGIVFGLGGR